MSDDERDVDIESEDDDMGDDDLNEKSLSSTSSKPMTQAEKRAHHNALERKRRDHIKDSFTSLRDSVPSLHGEKSSRAQILKKAAEYIQFMRRKNSAHQHDIEDLKRQNHVLENQIRALERARLSSGIRTASATVTTGNNLDLKSLRTRHSESDNSDSEPHLNFSSVGSTNSTSAITVSGGTKKLKVLTVGTPAK